MKQLTSFKQISKCVLSAGALISPRIFSVNFPLQMLRLYETHVQMSAQRKAVAFLGGIQSVEWNSEDQSEFHTE